MVLQIFFTEDEIRTFFESNGFKCEMRDFGHWAKTTHRDSDWIEYPRLAVVFEDGKHVLASRLFEQVTTCQMKRQICPSNPETRQLIETTYNNLNH